MRAQPQQPGFPRRDPEHAVAFRVVMLYDDYAAGRAAMDTYQTLLSQFSRQLDFRIGIWRFDLLQSPMLAPEAVGDAVEADAIIVATRRADGLPDGINRWIDAWIPRKRGQTAVLIALLDDLSAHAGTQECLKRAAADAGIDFLACEIRPAAAPAPAAERHPNCRLAPEGWGLND